MQTEIQARFEAAITTFVNKIKSDPNILAIIVLGSLANDTVWEKSDIDTYVMVREMKLNAHSFCIEEDGIIINVVLQNEFDFKRRLERSLGGGFTVSFFAHSRVVYAKDAELAKFMEDIQKPGKDDTAMSFFQEAASLVYYMEKIEKWLTVKDDPLYAQKWILDASYTYANMLLILANKPPSREAVLKVTEFAPELMEPVYRRPLSGFMSRDDVADVLNMFKKFLVDNLEMLKKPVVDFMSDGQVRTITALVKHYGMDSHHIYHVFDILEEMGIVTRVTETVKITPKSRRAVEEVAFMYIERAV